jgi:hypothetical protein
MDSGNSSGSGSLSKNDLGRLPEVDIVRKQDLAWLAWPLALMPPEHLQRILQR